MFRFNMSEEIIFSIKNEKINDSLFTYFDSKFLNNFIDILINENVLVVFGFDNYIREELLKEVIIRIFKYKYSKCSEIDVFLISNIYELEEVYNKDRFQIFYLDDFFGILKENEIKKSEILFKNLSDKFLIINTRDFAKNNFKKTTTKNLQDNREEIVDFLSLKFTNDRVNNSINQNNFKDNLVGDFCFKEFYSQLSFMDKFVLISVFMESFDDVDIWIKVVSKYFSNKTDFSGVMDCKEIILESFKKLEDRFIYLNTHGKIKINNLIIDEFLKSKIYEDIEIVKHVLNNMCFFKGLEKCVELFKSLNISFSYTNEYYEKNFKNRLIELIGSYSFINPIDVLCSVLDVFSLMGIKDESIIHYLNTKIIYSNIDEFDYIKYFRVIKNFKEYLIKDEIFIRKIFDLINRGYSYREFEFYNHNFQYFLFVSEFIQCYKEFYEDEFNDILDHFNRLTSMILNYINSYFSFEYFNLNNEIKILLNDLKVLIKDLGFKIIFSNRIDEIFYKAKDKLYEVLIYACNLIPSNKQEYYALISFQNELEVNKYFIESTFEDISIDEIINDISRNIYFFNS